MIQSWFVILNEVKNPVSQNRSPKTVSHWILRYAQNDKLG